MTWDKDFFGQYYLPIHIPLLTEEVNSSEVDFIEKVLSLPIGSEIMDLPCGFGRHSNILAERGYQVTGVDYKDEFLQLAKENCKVPDKVNYIQMDMRELTFENKFDGIINLFTSFGYFTEDENFRTLLGMAKALKPGGKLVIDMLNREWALNQTRSNGLVWLLYPDNKVFLANNKFDIYNGRWISEQIVVDKGIPFEQHQDVRLYSFTEMKFLMAQAGMEVIGVYGEKDLSDYSVDSKNMIVVARKLG